MGSSDKHSQGREQRQVALPRVWGAGIENALEQEEKEYGKAGAGRQRDNPGHENRAHCAQVQRGDAAGKSDPQDRANQRMGSGDGQTCRRSDHHGTRSPEFRCETAAGRQFGDFTADGGDYPPAIGSQTYHDAQRAHQQNPPWHG